MTTLLLDTHVALWVVTDSARVGPGTRQRLLDPETVSLVSVASVWEATIKTTAGRLQAPPELWVEIERSGIAFVAIDRDDAIAAGTLPRHHGDPFDRMIVAQAIRRDAWLVTADSALSAYEVRTVRADE